METLRAKKWSVFSRKSGVRATIVALVVASSVAYPRPAKAEITVVMVAAIIGYIQQAYSLFSTASEILGGGGPSLAEQLSAVQTTLLNELRTQRNQQWRAQAQTAFDDFRFLAVRDPSDPSNAALWNEATGTNTQTALNQYSMIAGDGLDVASAKQLAPMYYALVTTWGGLQRMKGQIYPDFPAQWVAYHLYLQQAIDVGYKLVGAHATSCWAGSNPGKGQYMSSPTFQFTDQYAKSQLFEYLEHDKFYPTDYPECGDGVPLDRVMCSAALTAQSHSYFCEPAGCLYSGNIVIYQQPDRTPERLRAAREIADVTDFSQDGVVRIVQKAMLSILDVGGGEDPASDSDTSLPEQSGMLVDPWVNEGSCAVNGPWAYPTLP